MFLKNSGFGVVYGFKKCFTQRRQEALRIQEGFANFENFAPLREIKPDTAVCTEIEMITNKLNTLRKNRL